MQSASPIHLAAQLHKLTMNSQVLHKNYDFCVTAVLIETADVSIETAGIQDPRSKILRGYWKCILESYILDPSRFN